MIAPMPSYPGTINEWQGEITHDGGIWVAVARRMRNGGVAETVACRHNHSDFNKAIDCLHKMIVVRYNRDRKEIRRG